LKYVLLKTQYRSPINLDDSTFLENINNLHDIYRALEKAEEIGVSSGFLTRNDKEIESGFQSAMNNDFNTPGALVALATGVNRLDLAIAEGDKKDIKRIYWTIKRLGKVLFLFQEKDIISQLFSFISKVNKTKEIDLEYIEESLRKMQEARDEKKYEESDRIRDELASFGIAVMQGESGIDWKFRTNLS
jgi:cysteinyl-tRNA synthetase